MKNFTLLYLFLCVVLCKSVAQSAFFDISDHLSLKGGDNFLTQSPKESPLREIRAVWLTTIGGIDWPHTYAQSEWSARKQQEELCGILDKLAAAGVNTIMLQTRVRATTIFPSEMEPWDGCLSGVPGKSPGYDALAFAINECHKRGMKLHAWVVAIPVGRWNGVGCKALRKSVPSLLKKVGDEAFMNPEQSGTADYLARFCGDIVKRYDVDGIHLDYIRYPDTWRGDKRTSTDVKRAHITRIAKAVSRTVKNEKPWVMMSCSPVGKRADIKRAWSHGWNARDIVFQDAAKWLDEGVMDALFPMMYFKGENFYPFLIDWKECAKEKIITPGLGIYFISPREKNWALEEITREMHVARQYGMGVCMFRSKFLTDNTKGLYDYTKTLYSPQPSLQPVMTWYEALVPQPPHDLKLMTDGKKTVLTWYAPNTMTAEGTTLQYNVYGAETAPVDVSDPKNLLAGNVAGNAVRFGTSERIRCFAVTSTDRYGNESSATQLVGTLVTEDATQMSFTRKLLPYNGTRIDMTGTDVTEGQLVVLTSVMEHDLRYCFVKQTSGQLYVEAESLKAGNYKVIMINRKGHRHLLGLISIEPKE